MGNLVLVTGGAGFIGTYVVRALVAADRAVRVLDSLDLQVHEGRQPTLPSDVEFVEGDVADPGVWPRALEGVSGVIHLAAAVGVGQSMYEVARYCRANVMGTARLLEALIARRNQTRAHRAERAAD